MVQHFLLPCLVCSVFYLLICIFFYVMLLKSLSRWEIGEKERLGPTRMYFLVTVCACVCQQDNTNARQHECKLEAVFGAMPHERLKLAEWQEGGQNCISPSTKGAADRHCQPYNMDFPHLTNNTFTQWIMHVDTIAKPLIQSLKGLLLFVFSLFVCLWPFSLVWPVGEVKKRSAFLPVDGAGDPKPELLEVTC